LQGLRFSNLFSFFFFNSYYSILPWICFFLFGMLYGRNDLRLKGILPPSSLFSIFIIGVAFFVQYYSAAFYTEGDKTEYLHIFPFNVRLYMPSFIIFGLGATTLLLNTLIYVFRRDLDKQIVRRIQGISGSKYSVVFFHLIFSVIILSITNVIAFRSKWSILVLAMGTVSLSIFVTLLWKNKISDTTPVEWFIKRLSSSSKK
jgi:predicted acyltransferase